MMISGGAVGKIFFISSSYVLEKKTYIVTGGGINVDWESITFSVHNCLVLFPVIMNKISALMLGI